MKKIFLFLTGATLLFFSCSGREEAPDFVLNGTDGSIIKLSDYRGKIVLIDFWATWCPPCRRGIPDLISLKNEYVNHGFEVIGISVDAPNTKGDIPAFIQQYGINYPIVYANQKVVQDYGGVSSIPATFIIDRQGEIVSSYIGLNPKQKYAADIERILTDSQNIDNEITIELRQLSNKFTQKIISVLMNEIQQNGIPGAVKVCSESAQQLTKQFGENNNIIIRRVSLKTRNKLNNPDPHETKILQEFENLYTKGELGENVESSEIYNRSGVQYIRYMKPIIVKPVCLNCHGDEAKVLTEVAQLISKKYPEDFARNYAVGDLRGAISVMKVLN